MHLVFEVCGADLEVQETMCKAFVGAGGIIGRGADCDWVLCDTQRLLSSRHAVITFRNGRYFLTDISSNGICLADGEWLLAGRAHPIEDGAVFQLGPLNIRARLAMAENSVMDDPAEALASENPTRPEVLCWLDDPMAVPVLLDSVPDAMVSTRVEAGSQRDKVFWSGFAQALGISLDTLDETERKMLAVRVAALLRQMVEGLQQSLGTRNELRAQMKLTLPATTSSSQDLFSGNGDAGAVLQQLLGPRQVGELSAERAVMRAHQEMQAHQLALLVACRATVRGTLAAFAPSQLLACFECEEKPALIPTGGARWRAYQRHYKRLVGDEQLGERPLSGEFARAYAEQVRLISTLHHYPG